MGFKTHHIYSDSRRFRKCMRLFCVFWTGKAKNRKNRQRKEQKEGRKVYRRVEKGSDGQRRHNSTGPPLVIQDGDYKGTSAESMGHDEINSGGAQKSIL